MVRGEVLRLPSPKGARGREQGGRRPGVVVQADELLGLSTIIVAPTSTAAAAASFRPTVVIADTPTRVLVDQLRVFDAQTVGPSLGRLDVGELQAIDDALTLVLGL